MHDCRQTQDNLIDLVFDETNPATRARLLAEVERCAACAAEYRSFSATLDACDDASAALAPGESYWPQYHAALTRRLHGAARAPRVEETAAPTAARASLWKRLLTTSIRVPAPLAAAAMLLLVASSVLALALLARPAPEPVVIAAPQETGQPSQEAAPQIEFIEVPVVREKTVTQIVYRPRRNGEGEARRFATRENLAGVGRQNAASPGTNAANATTTQRANITTQRASITTTRANATTPRANATTPTRANLSGFKPVGEVNLRIIKGSEAHEQ